MKALISPNENVLNPNTKKKIGVRVCEIVDVEFEVANTLLWVDCLEHIDVSTHCYDLEAKTFVDIPEFVPVQLITTGTQDL